MNTKHYIEVKIDNLNIGDSVRDIQMNGVELLESPNNVITAVKTTWAIVADTQAVAAYAAVAKSPAVVAKK